MSEMKSGKRRLGKMSKKQDKRLRWTISVYSTDQEYIDQGIRDGRFGDRSHAFHYGILCAQREEALKLKIKELEKIVDDYKKQQIEET